MLSTPIGPLCAFLVYLSPASATPAEDAIAIPAGDFVQGNTRVPDERQRQVTLSAYRIDRSEVSIAAFETFAASGYTDASFWSEEGWRWAQENQDGASAKLRAANRSSDHPVVAVNWFEADAYCRWAGGALPTEAQWEHAACGDGGQRFAWGDDEEVDAVWYGGGKFGHLKDVATASASNQNPTLASSFGLIHTAGNVWEWTADWYHRDGYAPLGEDATDPTGPETGSWRVLRGGSFMNLPSYCTCTHREPAGPERVAFTTGFRCAYPSP